MKKSREQREEKSFIKPTNIKTLGTQPLKSTPGSENKDPSQFLTSSHYKAIIQCQEEIVIKLDRLDQKVEKLNVLLGTVGQITDESIGSSSVSTPIQPLSNQVPKKDAVGLPSKSLRDKEEGQNANSSPGLRNESDQNLSDSEARNNDQLLQMRIQLNDFSGQVARKEKQSSPTRNRRQRRLHRKNIEKKSVWKKILGK